VIALVPRGPRWLASLVEFASVTDLHRKRRFLIVAAFAASFLSLGYIAFYLRGGPRASDAATYWLQGRALAHGALAWTLPDPSASFRARDLLFTAPDRLAGVFPPGYPLLLAPAFLVGAPMLVGPLLAAAIVVATWWLAREIALGTGEREGGAEAIARVAVGLSVLSVALRYHTADALPYGAAALAAALSLASALRARRLGDMRLFGAAGLSVGFLAATQPMAAVPMGAIVAALAVGQSRPRAVGWLLGAAVPGVLLLLAANEAAAGRPLLSPVAAYAGSFEPLTALRWSRVTIAALQRLRAHLLDVANFEPLALLCLVPALRRVPNRSAAAPWLALLVVAGQLLLALPSGGPALPPPAGARSLAAVVPVEHALMALALARVFVRSFAPAVAATFALVLGGFAVHASHDHEALAAAELGRPSFEPDVAREANVTHGLLFFEDDQGFELAYDPGVPASHGIQAARLRGDDHDRLLYDSLGHPAIHKYVAAAGSASVVFWSPPPGGSEWRFEAESDWPPLAASGGRAAVVAVPAASEGRAIVLEPSGTADATMTLALPVPRGPTPSDRKMWMATPRVVQQGGAGTGTLLLVVALDGPPVAQWTWEDAAPGLRATELPPQPVELGGDRPHAWLLIRAHGGPVAIDRTTLR
jgi:hypothetical protein